MRVFININTSHIHSVFRRTGGTTPYVVFVSRVSTMNHRHNTNLNNNRSRHRRALGRVLIRVSNFRNGRNVVIVTTAGHPSILSPTLLHPNHFSHRIIINLPSIHNHRRVLGIRVHHMPLTPSVSTTVVTHNAPNFSNTSLTGLIGRTTLFTTHNGGHIISVIRFRGTGSGVVVNTRHHSVIVARTRGRSATCRRTNRTVVNHLIPRRSPIRGIAVVPHNHTLNIAFFLPRNSTVDTDHRGLRDRVSALCNNHLTRRVVCKPRRISANTSGSVGITAGLTHGVIAR